MAIRFQKSKWSTKERVDYRLNLFVRHPDTDQMYDRANEAARELGREHETAPAGSWFSIFPGNVGPRGHHWISLCPGDDLSAHADHLVGSLDRFVFPEIQRQLDLPLVTPTPPSERAMAPDRGQLNRAALSRTIEALKVAGVKGKVLEVPDV